MVSELFPKLSRANRLVNPQMSNKALQKEKGVKPPRMYEGIGKSSNVEQMTPKRKMSQASLKVRKQLKMTKTPKKSSLD